MKALVVGGTGATGPFVIEGLLSRGYEVAMLHRGVHEIELPAEVEHIHADPHWLEALKEALQGRNFDLVLGTYGRLRITAEAVKGHTPRLISVGGAVAIYKGWMRITERHPQQWFEVSPVPIQEDHPLATAPGVDNFNQRARESEQVVMQAHRDGIYSATHFRYPTVYGPRNVSPQEWSIIRRIRDGRKQIIVPGGGSSLVSRGYAANVAHGILLAVDNPQVSAGQIYNVADETLTLTNREWIRLVAQMMGHQFEFIEIPFDMLPPAFADAPPPTLFPYHQVMDLTKIKVQLGYRDVVPVEKGIELTVKWFAENPLPTGGEVEKLLGDPFNYEAEDRLIEIYR
ncbi:MAG: NAD-dependent epimerase/dehydratase family protein, partial [Chloroflexi bacterium]|nr:NAD-dependent epimerase/dehydratase family protein [Chloroflexota bacterium]